MNAARKPQDTQDVDASTRDASGANPSGAPFDAEVRRRKIELLAYYKAEQRGFVGGHEVEDWLEAERQVDGEYVDARIRERLGHLLEGAGSSQERRGGVRDPSELSWAVIEIDSTSPVLRGLGNKTEPTEKKK